MAGAQAQVLTAAKMSVWSRLGSANEHVLDDDLWKRRSITRAWCMRRTMYLLPARDVAVYALGSARCADREVRLMLSKGISTQVMSDLMESVFASLSQPLTRKELVSHVAKSLGLKLASRQGGGWGSSREETCVKVGKFAIPAGYLLHLAGAYGVICSGPPRGNESRFVNAESWLREWRPMERKQAEAELLLRYLRAFGPSTPQDYAWWTGTRVSDAEEIWRREVSCLAQVDVAGWKSWILKEDMRELEQPGSTSDSIRLLPYFDSFLLGHKKKDHLVDMAHKGRVYLNQGWISPVLLIGGRVHGTWRYRRKGKCMSIEVETFRRMKQEYKRAIRKEAMATGGFAGSQAVTVSIK